MPACLRCRTLVDTKILLYVLCCSVQGRLKAVLLCLRYADTMYGFRSFARALPAACCCYGVVAVWRLVLVLLQQLPIKYN